MYAGWFQACKIRLLPFTCCWYLSPGLQPCNCAVIKLCNCAASHLFASISNCDTVQLCSSVIVKHDKLISCPEVLFWIIQLVSWFCVGWKTSMAINFSLIQWGTVLFLILKILVWYNGWTLNASYRISLYWLLSACCRGRDEEFFNHAKGLISVMFVIVCS